MKLWLYHILWRMLRHVDVGCQQYKMVVDALIQHQAFPLGLAIENGALLEGMSLFLETGSVVPPDPQEWAFHVYSRALDQPCAAEFLVGLAPDTRRELYASFRDTAVMLWRTLSSIKVVP